MHDRNRLLGTTVTTYIGPDGPQPLGSLTRAVQLELPPPNDIVEESGEAHVTLLPGKLPGRCEHGTHTTYQTPHSVHTRAKIDARTPLAALAFPMKPRLLVHQSVAKPAA